MIICIVGPTGVGKTKLSIMLAKKYHAIIINGDACQVYKELNIGTAKIKEEEKEGIPHYLLDIKEVQDEYSVCDYQKDIRVLLDKYKDRPIILVGGTGLYLKSALYDYEFSPLIIKDYRDYSNEELYEMAKREDANLVIDKNNRRRLENYLNRLHKVAKEPKLLYDVKFIGLTTDREVLYTKINERVDKMIDDGLVEEVKCLYQKYGKTKILSRAIGYKEIINYFEGAYSLEEAIREIKKNSRHYAKRQYTWFNNQMNINWFQTDYNDFSKTYLEVIKYIEKETK